MRVVVLTSATTPTTVDNVVKGSAALLDRLGSRGVVVANDVRVAPGWTYDGETFAPGAPVEPEVKTHFSYYDVLTLLHTDTEQARYHVAMRRAEAITAVDLLLPEHAVDLGLIMFKERATMAPFIDRTLPVFAAGLEVLKAAAVYGHDAEVADARIARVLSGRPPS